MYKPNIVDMDIVWMRYAIILAEIASLSGNIAIGAVLVYDGRSIGYGYNSTLIDNDPVAHAEIVALRKGAQNIGNYRLLNTTLYVTMEPCIMCIGAMIHARIYRLVCGARNNKICWIDFWKVCLSRNPMINHRFFVKTGVLDLMCSSKIKSFFKKLR